MTIRSYLAPKSVKLYTIFLHFNSILAKIFGGFSSKPPLQLSPISPSTVLPHIPKLLELVSKFSWITYEMIIRTLRLNFHLFVQSQQWTC